MVGLGALGAVTRLTLDVEPAYHVRQRVFEGLAWDALAEHFDEITASGYSVSLFTRWGETIDSVWVKSRVTDTPETVRPELFGARAATVDIHPIRGLDTVNVTRQLGQAGPWSDRLPHFRMGFTPSSGDEIQSEYFVAREHAPAAIEAVRRVGARVRPLLQVTEIRTIAADALWLARSTGRTPSRCTSPGGWTRTACWRRCATSKPRSSRSRRARTGARCSAWTSPVATSGCPTSSLCSSVTILAVRSAIRGWSRACSALGDVG